MKKCFSVLCFVGATENASAENASTNSQGWKMQLRKMQVQIFWNVQ